MITFKTIDEIHQYAKQQSKAERTKVQTGGLSSASFYAYGTHYFFKYLNYKEDALSLRTNDKGREYHILNDQIIDPLWDLVDNPYIASTVSEDHYGLLMRHLKAEFIASSEFNSQMQNVYIENLAKIHAAFWNQSNLKKNSNFLTLSNYIEMLGPKNRIDSSTLRINTLIEDGWEKAKALLSKDCYDLLLNTESIVNRYAYLPFTFLHGDYRPSNIGYNKANDKITLVDFAFSGYGPCTIDLFWYIATTTWLGTDYDQALSIYRNALEKYIGKVQDSVWNDFIEIGIIIACTMQLWEKALDFDKNPPDFNFWSNKLSQIKL